MSTGFAWLCLLTISGVFLAGLWFIATEAPLIGFTAAAIVLYGLVRLAVDAAEL